ncbi:hypothetical protein OPKNFCMD_0461 [Methylobacterium crusticola]|uniref:Type VI secretion system-associated protein TagF n=1 Tax=Methylobacterium crusticola TaxID=1697972 RepID=A0ABQ4QSU4_9HYPH|nr:type VI secretion system-associated protein TagF [Methylobacterium crusticola]GJD47751.1 hypothetical protein OPKNFCMD_0461 [Methylobacterium crusticola]
MRCGLYGKLPAKRDFVATGAPREFLAVWEPWVQGGVAASRLSLGAQWQSAFLQAPIWRFWLGRDLCGATTLGALMPSVDGVGRYFPLALFARAEPGESPAPPEIDAQDAWMAALEEILLSALAPETSLEQVTASLEALGPPASPAPAAHEGVARLVPAGWTSAFSEEEGAAPALGRLRQADLGRACAASSFWWTLGGGDFAPRALVTPGLPANALFSAMLTGALPLQSGAGRFEK